jgi:hypothetical protein
MIRANTNARSTSPPPVAVSNPTSGGRDGKPLAVTTVTHLHAILRKAFRDAVIVDELISSNPVERAKRPHAQTPEPGTVWTVGQLRAFLDTAAHHRQALRRS